MLSNYTIARVEKYILHTDIVRLCWKCRAVNSPMNFSCLFTHLKLTLCVCWKCDSGGMVYLYMSFSVPFWLLYAVYSFTQSVIMSKWGFHVDSENCTNAENFTNEAIRCVRPTDKAHQPNAAATTAVVTAATIFFVPFYLNICSFIFQLVFFCCFLFHCLICYIFVFFSRCNFVWLVRSRTSPKSVPFWLRCTVLCISIYLPL